MDGRCSRLGVAMKQGPHLRKCFSILDYPPACGRVGRKVRVGLKADVAIC